MKRIQQFSLTLAAMALSGHSALASTAYGDLNNFDAVNDTGQECHGFEIELDDVHSTDITYTYDWNHYGAPKIREDNTDPAHPKVFVRYEAKYDSATQTFSAFTAIPAAPLAPTDGHMCTDPTKNEGCEHFGVGYYGTPSTVKYNWLIEDPSAPGTLKPGPAVNVATPTWTYYPPNNVQPVAQVQAAIQAPPPPAAPIYEFGDAVWVKEIRTTSHNNNVVELRDLVSDDPNVLNDNNWKNGEPDEVEVEWQIMQTEFNAIGGGANGDLAGAPEDLPNGDEVVTRRYEFYKYAGPLDPETNEAKCDKYPQISDPADLSYKADCDPNSIGDIKGDYIGAQMAGFNVEAALGLIDHIQDGEINQQYPSRSLVVGGNTPYNITVTGPLPDGMTFNTSTGVLSGTPTVAGYYLLNIDATDTDGAHVTKGYNFWIVDPAAPNSKYPLSVVMAGNGLGSITGENIGCGLICSAEYYSGTHVTLTASPTDGSLFTGWSGDACNDPSASTCNISMDAAKTVTATFTLQQYDLSVSSSGNGSGVVSVNGIDCGATCTSTLDYGTSVSLTAAPAADSNFAGWSGCDSTDANNNCVVNMNAAKNVTAAFTLKQYRLSVSKSGTGTGTVAGNGINCGATCFADLNAGTSVTLTATPASGSVFNGWGGCDSVDANNVCIVAMTAAKDVTATFGPTPASYNLSVTISGAGSVASSPKGISCSSGTCSKSYKAESTVSLIAKPARRHTFSKWTGSVCNNSTSTTCSVPITQNQNVTANFN